MLIYYLKSYNRKEDVVKRHEKEINEEKKRREKVLSSMVNKTLPKISLIDRNFYLKFYIDIERAH